MLPAPVEDPVRDPVGPALPTRPTLRPGFAVVRRDAELLQVGVDPPHRAILPDVPVVRDVLASLRRGERPVVTTAVARDSLDALLRADLVVDATSLESTGGALAAAAHGRSGAERAARRAAARIEVRAEGPTLSLLGALLTELGCAPPSDPGQTVGSTPDLVVVAAAGPVPRHLLDDLVRRHVPHLLVSATAESVTVGPLALAGVTACVRCVDAHRGEHDPRRTVVWEQVSHLSAAPVDPALWTLALAWAARDVVAYVDGDTPATWSASAQIAPGAVPELTRWLRHPHCGCSWDDARG